MRASITMSGHPAVVPAPEGLAALGGGRRLAQALKTPATLSTLAALLAVAYAVLLGMGHHPARLSGWGVAAELTVLSVLAQLYPIKFAPKRVTTASLGAAFALVLVTNDLVAVPLVIASQLAGQAILMAQGKRGVVSVVFNPLQMGLAAAASAAVLQVTPWTWVGSILAGTTMYLVSALAVASFTVFRNGSSWRKALLSGRRESVEHGAGTLLVGWLMAAALHEEALVPLAMVLQVAALTVATSRLNRLQAQAVALQQAETEAQIRRELLQVAAHELRTPITSLRGYADFFTRKLGAGADVPPQLVQRAMHTINSQAGRLARLIDQLLDFTRLENGRLVLRREHVDLVALTQNVVEEVRAVSPGALFLVNTPPRLAADMDPLRIEQVLVNLLTNATKFSPEGSPIEVSARAQGDDVYLEVRDYGVGVPDDQRDAIFLPFVQAHRDAAVGGLGLGLFVTREIVVAHGGSVHVEPASDRGSRFVVHLPSVVVRGDRPGARPADQAVAPPAPAAA